MRTWLAPSACLRVSLWGHCFLRAPVRATASSSPASSADAVPTTDVRLDNTGIPLAKSPLRLVQLCPQVFTFSAQPLLLFALFVPQRYDLRILRLHFSNQLRIDPLYISSPRLLQSQRGRIDSFPCQSQHVHHRPIE